jgi:SHS2 domain-containing protein
MIKTYRFDHTADMGFTVEADSLESLFKAAAIEMTSILCPDLSSIRHREEHSLSVEGEDLEELLVNWLSEINVLFQTEGILMADPTALTINDNSILHAKFAADHYDPERHTLGTEIKAVTYHKLFVKHTLNGWKARLIFDI